MQLDEFISEALKAIIKGVKDAQEFAQENGARINPHKMSAYRGTDVVYYGKEEGQRALTKINFDIAITVSAEKGKEAKAGISVWSIGIGGNLSDKELNQTVSRIQFSIDTVLPNVIA